MPTRLTLLLLLFAPVVAAETLPGFLADRGTGVSTSMFGTYIRRGEILIYPFFEAYRDADFEYAPEEFGYDGSGDYRGRYEAQERLLFLAYGITEDLSIELEAAYIDASFEKAPDDPSAMPDRIEESGVGDIEGQLRWRWMRETATRPEFFSYFEAVSPRNESKPLIGTPEWELKVGTGAIRGFRWGTVSARAALEYTEGKVDLGEYALEYIKRLHDRVLVYAGLEGSQVDEVSLIGELQFSIVPSVILKLNAGIGLTSKATDWAPEIGVLFRVPTRRLDPQR